MFENELKYSLCADLADHFDKDEIESLKGTDEEELDKLLNEWILHYAESFKNAVKNACKG